jgi:hypothetical protein
MLSVVEYFEILSPAEYVEAIRRQTTSYSMRIDYKLEIPQRNSRLPGTVPLVSGSR